MNHAESRLYAIGALGMLPAALDFAAEALRDIGTETNDARSKSVVDAAERILEWIDDLDSEVTMMRGE